MGAYLPSMTAAANILAKACARQLDIPVAKVISCWCRMVDPAILTMACGAVSASFSNSTLRQRCDQGSSSIN